MRSLYGLCGIALAVAALALLQGPAAAAEPAGDSQRGVQVFTRKGCVRCHGSAAVRGVGPALEELRRPQGAYTLAGRFWNHAPGMFTVFSHEKLEWPTFTEAEMADLMAYLRADSARDPKPDAIKGQMVLVGKGCLKCHSFRKEGGRVGPDLADVRGDYAPAARWAMTIWGHTPRMAAAALVREVLYPRFSGDEMVNLIGFLRSDRTAR